MLNKGITPSSYLVGRGKALQDCEQRIGITRDKLGSSPYWSQMGEKETPAFTH